MAIAALLVRDEDANQRHNERWVVRIGARSSCHGPYEHPLTVLNLSQKGLLLETDQILPVNSSLVVELPCGIRKVCATIWNSGRQHGAIFGQPLSNAELQAVLAPGAAIRFPPNELGKANQTQRSEPGWTNDNDWSAEGPKYPRSVRLLIGAGASVGLWGIIGSALWLASS